MIIEVVCVLFLSYMIYRQGIRQLFKSRIFSSIKADHFAYMFFMLAGMMVGTLITLSFIQHWWPETSIATQIIATTVISIIVGEWMYHRNKNLIYKLVTPQSKETSEE